MRVRTRITAVAAAAALAGLGFAGFSGVANAQSCPSGTTCSGTVSGTLLVNTTLTFALSSNSFPTLALTPGQIDGTATSGANEITATVTTNDNLGYTETNELGTDFTAGAATFEGQGGQIEPYITKNASDNPNAFATVDGLTPAGTPVEVDYSTGPVSADVAVQAWNFYVPGTIEGGSYIGSLTVEALANLAMTTSGGPFVIELSKISSSAIGITDRGTVALHVKAGVSELHPAVACTVSAAKGVTITPGVFTVKPGATVVTAVHVSGNAAPGEYILNYAANVPTHSNVHLSGEVGARLLVKTGHVSSCTHHVAALPATTSGFPIVWLVVGLLALVLAVVGTAMWRRRRA